MGNSVKSFATIEKSDIDTRIVVYKMIDSRFKTIHSMTSTGSTLKTKLEILSSFSLFFFQWGGMMRFRQGFSFSHVALHVCLIE